MSEQLSASVLIGHAPDEPITSENVGRILPDERTVDVVCGEFVALGFDVGEPFGLTVSISASREHFRDVFGDVVDQIGEGEVVLPLDRLPADLAHRIGFVWCSAPPDFGPGSP